MSSKSETNNSKDVNRFQNIVKTLNLKQSDIAAKLNISRQYVNNCYHGREKLSEEKLLEFSKAYKINLHYYFTGEGNMFLNSDTEYKNTLEDLKQKFNLSDEDFECLIELLNSGISRDMILKFIQVKKGNKEALEALINNLNGIKAAYNFGV